MKLVAYSHVPKCGGSTVRNLLRRNLGILHLDILNRKGTQPFYSANSLASDLLFSPWLKSIAGHTLKPCVDYSNVAELTWYTILRDPSTRFLSHYQQEVEKGKKTHDIFSWAQSYNRADFQVRTIAGERDLNAAKQILTEKFAFVGLQEKFPDTLNGISNIFGSSSFCIHLDGRKNVSDNKRKAALNKLKEKGALDDLLLENNSLDIELYEFVKKEIWPKQVHITKSIASPHRRPVIESVNLSANFLYRNCYYKLRRRVGF